VDKFSHTRFEPAGFTQNQDIPFAKSVVDYVFRWLSLKFLSREEADAAHVTESNGTNGEVNGVHTTNAKVEPKSKKAAPSEPVPAVANLTFLPQEDAPSCSYCGSIMVRNGACYKCANCGATSGCS
jgi:ribonucleoside-diphosphate reductase alpha chain